MEQTPDQTNPECGTQEMHEPLVEVETRPECEKLGSDVPPEPVVEGQVGAVKEQQVSEEQVECKKQADGEKDSGPPVLEEKGEQITQNMENLGASTPDEMKSVKGPKAEQEEQVSVPDYPGSLPFPFLEAQAKAFLCASYTLLVVKGLPGSGKSHLAKAIKDACEGVCAVISADDHNVKPEDHDASHDALKALDEAVLASLAAGTAVVVVDDTNHTPDRLAQLSDLAVQHQYCTLFLEPQTEWSQDVEQLLQKTQQKLDKKQIEAMKTTLQDTSIPLFYGWFLCRSFQKRLRTVEADFLRILSNVEAFKCHINYCDAEKPVNLEEHFHHNVMLYCTTKFCDYGKAEGAKAYSENQFVKKLYGSFTELVVSSLFVTPRTLGAKVALTEKQLQLWPVDAENEAMHDANLDQGSCAHITLGCADGVEPVEAGLDLLELFKLQQAQGGESHQDLNLGLLVYYGEGMWMLSLREPCKVTACFSSYYGPREKSGKEAEMEKKKKLKCMVL